MDGGKNLRKIKILHCSDLHFDSPFSELDSSFSENRKEDLRECFGNIVDMAKSNQVDLLLISGDIFDNGSVMKNTLDYIRKKFEEIHDIRVFIAPGNHDPFNEKSFYSMLKWPENVHVFKDKMEKIQIDELKLCVYGRGFSNSYERESLLKDFRGELNIDEYTTNIMVLHGDIANKGTKNDYNPVTLEEIGLSGMDYIALGHRHSFSGINREKNTYYAYSGNPEGRGFDETGEKGIILGEVCKKFVDLKFVPISKRQYIIKEIDISKLDTYDEIIYNIENSISPLDREKNLYKFILKGEVDPEFVISKSVIEEKMKQYFYYAKVVDKTGVKIDYEALSKEFSLKGLFTKKMLQSIENAEDETEKEKLKKALKVGIQSLCNKELKIE